MSPNAAAPVAVHTRPNPWPMCWTRTNTTFAGEIVSIWQKSGGRKSAKAAALKIFRIIR
jgi:hypothetical protein